jgi:hypothetical protein
MDFVNKQKELSKVTEYDRNIKIQNISTWSLNVIPWEIYNKFWSVPYSIGFYLGLDILNIQQGDPQLSIFLTNYKDRGNINNYRKKLYMSALTTNVIENYEGKIDKFLDTVLEEFNKGKPILSSFKIALINFFLDIHVGTANHPNYVYKYFEIFIDIISYGNPDHPGRNDAMLFGNTIVPKVKEYFSKRNENIKENKDKTTILYFWNNVGLNPESLIMEAIHNIIAFSQFVNILYLLLKDKIENGYNFFSKIKDTSEPEDKLNVVREAYRLLVPNNMSFSCIKDNEVIQTRHLHKEIMIQNNPYHYQYNTDIYKNFRTNISNSSSDLLPIDNFNPNSIFTVSDIDNETILQKNNTKIIPIYSRPIYCPFGLGYRRCAGEIFNYYITLKIMDKYKDLNFYYKDINKDKVSLAPFLFVKDNIYSQ